jgi:hypothetical protein
MSCRKRWVVSAALVILAGGALATRSRAAEAEAEPSGEKGPTNGLSFRARVVDLRMVNPFGVTRVVLEAEGPPPKLAGRPFVDIYVGRVEGEAIARGLRGERTARPMTHDLLGEVVKGLEARIERLTVTKLEGGVYFAELVLVTASSEKVKLDSRPSDGTALAVAAGAPIYVSEAVLREAGRPAGGEVPSLPEGMRPGGGPEEEAAEGEAPDEAEETDEVEEKDLPPAPDPPELDPSRGVI